MPEEKFKGLVIKILSIKVTQVTLILVGLLNNGISNWEKIEYRNGPDRLLNRSIY